MAAAAPTRLWTPWRTLYLHVENANVLQYEADVVALKYAQGLHGADREAVEALGKKLPKLVDDMPLSGEFRLVNSFATSGCQPSLVCWYTVALSI